MSKVPQNVRPATNTPVPITDPAQAEAPAVDPAATDPATDDAAAKAKAEAEAKEKDDQAHARAEAKLLADAQAKAKAEAEAVAADPCAVFTMVHPVHGEARCDSRSLAEMKAGGWKKK